MSRVGDQLLESIANSLAHLLDLAAAPAPARRPIYVATVLLKDDGAGNGRWHHNFETEICDIRIANAGDFLMTLAYDAPAEQPVDGIGVLLIPPDGRPNDLPARGHVITLYGTVGERATVIVWASKAVEL